MKIINLFMLLLIPMWVFGQQQPVHLVENDRLVIELAEGKLNIIPLSEKSVRVQLMHEPVSETQELILVNQLAVPDFEVVENDSSLLLKTSGIQVNFDKNTQQLSFHKADGSVFLKESINSRKFEPSSIQGENCFIAGQGFESPEDELILGLGQFQDGHYNLKGVSRNLIQVNTQIAIPFIYSNKGYGLLWHQYGLTEFNPTDKSVDLVKDETAVSEGNTVEITTAAGTQKVSQRESLYSGSFELENDGEYVFMLDMGGMENRHFLAIDDTVRIDQSNLWLPPSVSVKLKLKAGGHNVKVICQSSNTPTLGYALSDNITTFRSPHAKALDFVVFAGDSADEIITNYRELSGTVPMLPFWAFGFWQCRERYNSSEELISTVREFRKRNLPLDVIVQDWQYWGDNGWGVPQLDPTRYPDPSGLIDELHRLNAHFAISIWSNPDKNSEIGNQYVDRELYIPDTKWLDYFNPETGERYWQTLKENLFTHGVDAWWMDATEPENDALVGANTYLGPGEFYRLTYPLFVSKSVYEGQLETNPNKRVTILTRSAFAGQQRYGTINWSGDIGGTWDSYQRQIVAGLNYSMTGMPFWTTDIGGFFRPGSAQYTDENYRELLTRWFQWGAFNTIFRMHGYQSETEPWKYGVEVENNMRKMLNIRYKLLPYIYSEAWKITNDGYTMMRPLPMDFPNDKVALHQELQYMFGSSLLVAPVTENKARTISVYLPKANGWYELLTGKKFTGGQEIEAVSPLDQIPVFVKAGSIIPVGKAVQHSQESTMDTLTIRIYTGADATFELYNDEKDNTNYQKGAYTLVPFRWNEKEQNLTVEKRQGTFEGAPKKQLFKIVWIDESSASGLNSEGFSEELNYTGEKIQIWK